METIISPTTGNKVEGTIKFGLGQINNVTPNMANWIFRGYFIISKAIIGWLAVVKWLTPNEIYNVSMTVTLLVDPIILGFSKLFGIEPTVPEQPVNKPPA